MRAKILVLVSLLFLCQISFAETCPSVTDVKTKVLAGWQLYDSEDGTQLSEKRAVDYKKNIKQFALVESATNDGKHRVHCYYRDASGSDLEAYLGKNSLAAKQGKNYWYQVSGSMQCAAGTRQCEFQTALPQQLATK